MARVGSGVPRCILVLIAVQLFAGPTMGAESVPAIPDLSGVWAREFIG